MNLKKPLSYDDQLKTLKAHGVGFDNSKEAEYKRILGEVNYYRLSGYALQFRMGTNDSNYAKGTSFEQIYDIYKFDDDVRQMIRKYIEITEVYFRTQIAYNFALAKCKNAPHDQHYDRNNYFNKKGFDEVINSFQKEKNYYKDSLIVKHHIQKYSNKMPLWVIVELMSFSNISKLYNTMYYSEKDAIANAVGTGRTMLENNLHCLSVLRNKCAHAARLYNTEFNPPVTLPATFLRKHPEVKNNSLFAYLLVLLRRLPNDKHKNELAQDINKLINKYTGKIDINLIGFPSNYFDLLSEQITHLPSNR